MSTRFRPPRQHRSQETLDRILDAAEQVLDTKSFSEATLAEIMERAGVTVGGTAGMFAHSRSSTQSLGTSVPGGIAVRAARRLSRRGLPM